MPKIVWHCDGDVRPILNDILNCGIGGLQGFQRECGMDLNWIADLKTRDGEPLLDLWTDIRDENAALWDTR